MYGYKVFFCLFILLVASLLSSAQAAPSLRTVDLTAPDSTPLKGTYFPAAKPGPGVLLLHQCNRDRKAWDALAKSLNRAGINVLAMDNRGFGESGGKRYDTLTPDEENKVTNDIWPGDFDVAFQYLLSQPGVQRDKIGAGGASCGVNNAIQLARRHAEVKALVLLSGGTNRDGRLFLQKSNSIPVFTAAADDDVFGNVTQIMQWFYSLSPNRGSRFQQYATGGHGAEMFGSHPELLELIVRWVQATLNDKPDQVPSTNGTLLPADLVRNSEVIEQADGITQASKMLAEARHRDRKAVVFSEFIVNYIGYEHMLAGDTKSAVEIMKLNATAFPDSPNVYDSLGDAYLADGQKEQARASAKKALAMLPSDTRDSEQKKNGIRQNSEKKLKDLGQETK